MAMHRVYYVACDDCGEQHKGKAIRIHKAGAKRAARRDGWQVSDHEPYTVAFCPDCDPHQIGRDAASAVTLRFGKEPAADAEKDGGQ